MDTLTLVLIGLAVLVVVVFAVVQLAFCFLKPLILKLFPEILYFVTYVIVNYMPSKPVMHSTFPPGPLIMRASFPAVMLGILIGWALYASFVYKNRQ